MQTRRRSILSRVESTELIYNYSASMDRDGSEIEFEMWELEALVRGVIPHMEELGGVP